jgi:UDP-hydrolysing UDP-N-acetyl-D-glucosamine 2-epimerase
MTSSGSVRRVAVFTATRAEYGLLYPVITEILRAEDLELKLIVAGSHMAPSQGSTVTEIESDGVPVESRVVSLVDNDEALGATYSMALTLQGVARELEVLKPDIILVLGDRYEALAAGAAAMMARIPIAHIHGGEATEGLIDEAIRHSLTKMSHLHFVAAQPFAERVIQLGEDPSRVHVVGAPGLDNIRTMELLSRQELASRLGWEATSPYLLVTYHPVTLRSGTAGTQMDALLHALTEQDTHRVLFTAPNVDPGGSDIRGRLEELSAREPEQFHFVRNLGKLLYLSALKHADAVVGNSSSGLIEAPFLGTPTVNIGERQEGRLRGETIVDCEPTSQEILSAISSAGEISGPEESLYGDGFAAPRIAEVLGCVSVESLLVKPFYSLRGFV